MDETIDFRKEMLNRLSLDELSQLIDSGVNRINKFTIDGHFALLDDFKNGIGQKTYLNPEKRAKFLTKHLQLIKFFDDNAAELTESVLISIVNHDMARYKKCLYDYVEGIFPGDPYLATYRILK